MNAQPTPLSSLSRWILMACGPMNLGGALCFSPFFPAGRQALHLPEADDFYLALLSTWILAFGVAYFYQGWTGRLNRTVLTLGAWGKGTFAGLMLYYASTGKFTTLAAAAALPDLLLACWFLLLVLRKDKTS